MYAETTITIKTSVVSIKIDQTTYWKKRYDRKRVSTKVRRVTTRHTQKPMKGVSF